MVVPKSMIVRHLEFGRICAPYALPDSGGGASDDAAIHSTPGRMSGQGGAEQGEE